VSEQASSQFLRRESRIRSGVEEGLAGDSKMIVAGVDGCAAGWVAFRVELPSLCNSIEVVDLQSWLRKRPVDLAYLGIDIPIGLFDRPRACDIAARKLLGSPRRNSVFPAPCRAALSASSHPAASACNRRTTGKGLTIQAWCICPKIKEVEDAITANRQRWAFEVHPEVCFWALNRSTPMRYRKKSAEGLVERLTLLRKIFPKIDEHLMNRPSGVGKDDLLDAAVAAWTGVRLQNRKAEKVCEPERDEKGLSTTIWY
jgi:predicted RNase H-like nuclease